jgi:D-serine deaminase-like pyridoxal phosphate-dependent protein
MDAMESLGTPALVLDRTKLTGNVTRMRDHLAALGVALRPHAKTAKNVEIVRMALEGQPGGITVSTLAEAEYFLGHGITDLVYAVGIAPAKLNRVADLMARGAAVTVITDSVAGAEMIAARGAELEVAFPVMIEIDTDGHRAGVAPDDPALNEIGSVLARGRGTILRGVLTHAGASYACPTTGDIAAMALRERDAAVAAAERLTATGAPCPVVSVGSTPTAAFAADYSGVTEVRAGVYVFSDLVMAGLGVGTIDDIALSVLCTVIGHRRDRGWVVTDGGWTALSRDRGTAGQAVDQGYGVVCDLDGAPLDDLIVVDTNQEHGIVARRGGGPLDVSRFPIGTRLRVLPNHACATGAAHDRYHVVDGTRHVTAVWHRIGGW